MQRQSTISDESIVTMSPLLALRMCQCAINELRLSGASVDSWIPAEFLFQQSDVPLKARVPQERPGCWEKHLPCSSSGPFLKLNLHLTSTDWTTRWSNVFHVRAQLFDPLVTWMPSLKSRLFCRLSNWTQKYHAVSGTFEQVWTRLNIPIESKLINKTNWARIVFFTLQMQQKLRSMNVHCCSISLCVLSVDATVRKLFAERCIPRVIIEVIGPGLSSLNAYTRVCHLWVTFAIVRVSGIRFHGSDCMALVRLIAAVPRPSRGAADTDCCLNLLSVKLVMLLKQNFSDLKTVSAVARSVFERILSSNNLFLELYLMDFDCILFRFKNLSYSPNS